MDFKTIAGFLADFTIVLGIIPLVIGIRAMPMKDKRLKLFFGYIVLGLITAIVSYLTRKSGNNIYLNYLYVPAEVTFLTLVLLPENHRRTLKLTALVFMSIVLLLNVAEAFLFETGITIYNSRTHLISSLLLGILSIGYLIKLRFDSSILNLGNAPMFWIAMGIAIQNLGNIITVGFYSTVQQASPESLFNMAFTSLMVTYVATTLFSIGLWKAKKNNSKNVPNLAT